MILSKRARLWAKASDGLDSVICDATDALRSYCFSIPKGARQVTTAAVGMRTVTVVDSSLVAKILCSQVLSRRLRPSAYGA